LDHYTGWWRGVTTGDIDGDGRLDIVASNWGLNSDYEASRARPVQLFYGDFTGRGMNDLIETAYDAEIKAMVPRRDRQAMGLQFPFFVKNFPTHKEYGEATMEQVLAALPKRSSNVHATTLASMIFFNRTNSFKAMGLPDAAQLAPAFGVNVADFDGDGSEDIFMSQNFSHVPPEETRLDAGRGLLLRGLGAGELEAVSSRQSGLLIYGSQRGSAVADFNDDGRLDLVVAQNGAETKVYKNISGHPGLRVHLKGPSGNPDGIGSTVRLIYGRRFGPSRAVRLGSGYWSQDSVVQVFSRDETPTGIWIRWPGGKATSSQLSSNSNVITVDEHGAVSEP